MTNDSKPNLTPEEIAALVAQAKADYAARSGKKAEPKKSDTNIVRLPDGRTAVMQRSARTRFAEARAAKQVEQAELEKGLKDLGLDRPPALISNADFQTRKNRAGWASSLENALLAMSKLGVDCRYDVFHNRIVVEDSSYENLEHVCLVVRTMIIGKFGFDPGSGNMLDAVSRVALQNQFDPVLDYLNGLVWGGVPRIDGLFPKYFNAENTKFNRAVGRKMMLAAVRRVRQPGCKFDTTVVLDTSKQGKGKSTAIRILAGDDNFSDEDIIGERSKERQELLEGIWIYEISELAGLRKAEIENVKSFLSRTVDRARPAYGRVRVDRPRRCIFIASTNDSEYLQDLTGNRRFWPVAVGEVDLEGLRRDRDQLWAEAAALEATGEELVIARDLWPEAEAVQESRMMADPWEEILMTLPRLRKSTTSGIVEFEGELRVQSSYVLRSVISIETRFLTTYHTRRLGTLMRKLGWSGPKPIRFPDGPDKGYSRPIVEVLENPPVVPGVP